MIAIRFKSKEAPKEPLLIWSIIQKGFAYAVASRRNFVIVSFFESHFDSKFLT